MMKLFNITDIYIFHMTITEFIHPVKNFIYWFLILCGASLSINVCL